MGRIAIKALPEMWWTGCIQTFKLLIKVTFFLKFETNVSCKGKDSLVQEVKNENQNMDAAMLNRPDAKVRLENNFTWIIAKILCPGVFVKIYVTFIDNGD